MCDVPDFSRHLSTKIVVWQGNALKLWTSVQTRWYVSLQFVLVFRLSTLSLWELLCQQMSFGRPPDKLLLYKIIDSSDVILKMDRGIGPWRKLELKSRETREERFPISNGMLPTSSIFEISNWVTLLLLESQITPIHLQTEVAVVQLFFNILWGSEVMKDLNARSEDSSLLIWLITSVVTTLRERNNRSWEGKVETISPYCSC